MVWTRRYATFTAAECAAVTGLDQQMQREWRRRGHLPPVASPRAKATFTAKELAQVYALAALARAGIGPATANVLAASCANIIMVYALEHPAAVSDPQGLRQGETLIHLPPHHERKRWMVTGDGRSWSWSNEPTEAVQAEHVVAIVMDLERAARDIVERARKPLVHIEPENA